MNNTRRSYQRRDRGILLCMTMKWIASLVAGTMLVPAGLAQKDAHSLQKELKGKQLVLRNYAAVPVASYTWSNGKLIAEPVTVYTFGVFTTKSVKLKGDKLIVQGERATMVRNTKTNARELEAQTPMRLEVDLNGADQSTVVSELQGLMFFPDVDAALAGLPPQIAGTLHISSPSETSSKYKWIFDEGKWLRVDTPSPRLVLPTLISSVPPEFSEKARRKKVAGNVLLYLTVSETGHVSDMWLGTGVGYDLDEEAEKAARQYVFNPATYDGKPIETVLGVEVNFEIF